MPRLEGIGSATAGLRLQPERDNIHTVRSGDTLNEIAKQHDFSLEELLVANPQIKNANRITVGQEIVLPDRKAQVKASQKAEVASTARASGATATETKSLIQFGANLLRHSLHATLDTAKRLETTAQRTIHEAAREVKQFAIGRNSNAPAAPAAAAGIAPKPQADQARETAFKITGVFESNGRLDALQTKDAGIVSYGKHQATLASGSLESILTRYSELAPGSDTARKLQGYMGRVAEKDETLRNDAGFHALLKNAAKEKEMEQAQEDVFITKYWEPASATAEAEGLTSPLARALLYDTNIQGGMNSVLKATKAKLKDTQYTEQEFLKSFLEERKDYLYKVAERKRGKNDEATAVMLEDCADTSRIPHLQQLVESGNLDLKGEFKVKGRLIQGG